jgi:hypothetical protein
LQTGPAAGNEGAIDGLEVIRPVIHADRFDHLDADNGVEPAVVAR